jgi:glutamyl-tRNA synthetase
MDRPRVRFAPSPTGYLHVGGARTALFNWLFARRYGGAFVLRIEDTDTERSSDEMVAGILESMRWLGLTWDEGPETGGPHAPYFQTQRFERHRNVAYALRDAGHAYRCYCAPNVLTAKREAAERAGTGWKYDRTCLHLSDADRERLESQGIKPAIRFKVPSGTTTYRDHVRGTIEFDHEQIEDFVILRSNGLPTYHLSVVVDDRDMQITHVIRGDDHISNTPKHILLWHAMGQTPPEFAHIPLILGADKKRLSKRHGATSVTEYQRLGYLPEAMVNFLALLGWSPGGDRELMTRDELSAAFTLDGISGGNAVFNSEKLDWCNAQYLARLDADDLLSCVRPQLEAAGLWEDALATERREWLKRVLRLVLPRVKRLPEFVNQARPFLTDEIEYDTDAVRKYLLEADLDRHVEALANALEQEGDPWEESTLERVLRRVADERRVKAAALIHAARIAATGKGVSPGIFEVLAVLGKQPTIERLRRLVAYLGAPAYPAPPATHSITGKRVTGSSS